MLRRRKTEVQRPAMRTEVILRCSLSEEEQALYNALLAGVRESWVSKPDVEILEAILRLRQAACHPRLLPGDNDLDSSKGGLLADKLEEAVADGIRRSSSHSGPRSLTSSNRYWRARTSNICALMARPPIVQGVSTLSGGQRPPVLIMSLKAGGVGLNLTAADHVFIMDPGGIQRQRIRQPTGRTVSVRPIPSQFISWLQLERSRNAFYCCKKKSEAC